MKWIKDSYRQWHSEKDGNWYTIVKINKGYWLAITDKTQETVVADGLRFKTLKMAKSYSERK